MEQHRAFLSDGAVCKNDSPVIEHLDTTLDRVSTIWQAGYGEVRGRTLD
jgi:hypothetical protein